MLYSLLSDFHSTTVTYDNYHIFSLFSIILQSDLTLLYFTLFHFTFTSTTDANNLCSSWNVITRIKNFYKNHKAANKKLLIFVKQSSGINDMSDHTKPGQVLNYKMVKPGACSCLGWDVTQSSTNTSLFQRKIPNPSSGWRPWRCGQHISLKYCYIFTIHVITSWNTVISVYRNGGILKTSQAQACCYWPYWTQHCQYTIMNYASFRIQLYLHTINYFETKKKI